MEVTYDTPAVGMKGKGKHSSKFYKFLMSTYESMCIECEDVKAALSCVRSIYRIIIDNSYDVTCMRRGNKVYVIREEHNEQH